MPVMQHRCMLRHTAQPRPLPDRAQVFKVTAKKNVHLTGLIPTPVGFIALCESSRDVDSLLAASMATALEKINLTPLPPQDLTAKRTVFVRGVEPDIGSRTAEEILEMLKEANEDLSIERVIKLPNRDRIMKVEMRDTTSTDRALKAGIKAGYQKIPPSNVMPQIIAKAQTCFHCYAVGRHDTKSCPNKNHSYCSNCAETGHTHKACPSQQPPRCLNCHRLGLPSDHHTLAMRCPARKEEVKKKKTQMEQAQKVTYAQAAAPPPPAWIRPHQPPPCPNGPEPSGPTPHPSPSPNPHPNQANPPLAP